MKRHFLFALAALTLSATNACGDDDDVSEQDANTVVSGRGGDGGSSESAGRGGRGAAGASQPSGSAGTSAGGSGGRSGAAAPSAASGSGGSGGRGGEASAGRAGAPNAGRGGKAASAGRAGEPGASDRKDIVETAIAAGSFQQLTAALTKAKLVDALKGDGPFTVFAPSDAAFAALESAQPGTLEQLSAEQLTQLLTYHVVAEAGLKAADLKDGQLIETLAGPVAAIDLSADKPKINGAIISTTDIIATNGVIHVIDAVLVPPKDIIEVATAAGSFSKLAAALTAAGLVDDLKGPGPFSVFAPTDAAFEALTNAPTGDALKNVLLYHVISGTLGKLDLKEGGAATTLASSPVLFSLKPGPKIDDAAITMTNIVAANGVIHVIDKVIIPPADDIVATATAAGSFTQLTAALTSAGLVSTLQGAGPFTVFAPTDAAFGKLTAAPTGDALKNVLLYHVVDGAIGSGDLRAGSVPTLLDGKSLNVMLGSDVLVDDAKVTMANILTKNGIIHVVDSVLVPK